MSTGSRRYDRAARRRARDPLTYSKDESGLGGTRRRLARPAGRSTEAARVHLGLSQSGSMMRCSSAVSWARSVAVERGEDGVADFRRESAQSRGIRAGPSVSVQSRGDAGLGCRGRVCTGPSLRVVDERDDERRIEREVFRQILLGLRLVAFRIVSA